MNQLTDREKMELTKGQIIKIKQICGLILLAAAGTSLLVRYYFINNNHLKNVIAFTSILSVVISLFLIIPFTNIFFDNHEWHPNRTLPQLIEKIRLRAVLFNNLSIGIFMITVLVIIAGFYVLINPSVEKGTAKLEETLTIRVSAAALLIFLVQILFRAFKYLLRVAAFYNGKADALEANALIAGSDLSKLMDMFTPDKYDISDPQSPALFDKLSGK